MLAVWKVTFQRRLKPSTITIGDDDSSLHHFFFPFALLVGVVDATLGAREVVADVALLPPDCTTFSCLFCTIR